jgi:hypothetical protein
LRAMQDKGMAVAMPEDVVGLGPDEIRGVAEDCGQLLDVVYKGTYPLAVGHAEILAASVQRSETHLSTLRGKAGQLVGMAALVEQPNHSQGPVSMVELGRACRHPDATDVHARPFLTVRVPWAHDNLPHADFLTSATRAAGNGTTVLPSGKGVQGVWVGHRAHGPTPLVVSGGSWRYRLGGVEPFLLFTMPTNPGAWARAVPEHPVFVPAEDDAALINTLITEGTDGKVRPDVRVVSAKPAEDEPFYQVDKPSNVANAKYVTGRTLNGHSVRKSQKEVDNDLFAGIGQEVVVDASTPRGAAIMQKLHNNGWTLVGWQPSEVEYGGIWPIMARTNPQNAVKGELVMPGHHAGYFDGTGLPHTRVALDGVYKELLAQVGRAPRPKSVLTFV